MTRARNAWQRIRAAVVAAGAMSLVLTVSGEAAGRLVRAAAPPPAAVDRQARLRNVQALIRRLQLEVEELRGREASLLGELERLGAQLRLSAAELEELAMRVEEVEEAIADRDDRIVHLERDQGRRRAYLAFRLREIYKEGADRVLRGFLGGEDNDQYWSGLRYAAYLSHRDGRVLRAFRLDTERLEEERAALVTRRGELRELEDQRVGVRNRLTDARRRRARLLVGIREDQSRRQTALLELRGAASALSQLVDALVPEASVGRLDVSKFRGLLDWPADGEVSAEFGSVIHPRFRTRVPHPGLDIEGDFNTTIRSVFEGTVVYAGWMRGYGLTAIVDHGGGVLSVSAHASVLLVEPGERVERGTAMGRVGETGSLRGPYLYFEIRVAGKPTDPRKWLRPRAE